MGNNCPKCGSVLFRYSNHNGGEEIPSYICSNKECLETFTERRLLKLRERMITKARRELKNLAEMSEVRSEISSSRVS